MSREDFISTPAGPWHGHMAAVWENVGVEGLKAHACEGGGALAINALEGNWFTR